MPEIFVGTSGWMYDWNPDGFEWFVKQSQLNAVELNMSFYRFPFRRQVNAWARRSAGTNLRWAIKVHQSITHRRLLSESSWPIWDRFRSTFSTLEPMIDFYLLQLPPRFKPTDKMLRRLEDFIAHANLGWKLAVEWRNPEWFNSRWVRWAEKLQVTVVSVDSPQALFYARSGPYVYLRLHGRTAWYAYRYSSKELKEVARRIVSLGAERIYVFFNNNHDMLDNAREMLKLLQSIL